MNRLLVIVIGILLTIAFCWTGIVFSSYVQLGGLEHYEDEATGEFYPPPRAGIAQRGQKVYQELGCVYCHSQQVRRPGYGSDQDRDWGERQSVSRDYIGDRTILLGVRRIGPDLMTVGERQTSRDWYHRHLYDPRINTEGSTMPSYRFLYEERRIEGEPSGRALDLPEGHRPSDGYEIVPTSRAEALVEYLLSLRLDYDLPEVPTE